MNEDNNNTSVSPLRIKPRLNLDQVEEGTQTPGKEERFDTDESTEYYQNSQRSTGNEEAESDS